MNPQLFSDGAVHAGDLILVNRQFAYVEPGSSPYLVPVGGQSVRLARPAARLLSLLMDRLNAWSAITPVSGWRSLAQQQDIWDQSLRENGPAFTAQFVALPGHSEHQTGLAIDLGLTKPEIDFIRPDFPDTGICRNFRALAASYGFVERYPAGKEAITGIAPEPWHFRFVGVPHARLMVDRQLTLEEYHSLLKTEHSRENPLRFQDSRADYTIFPWTAARERETPLNPDRDSLCAVSGDNDAGFVVTMWRQRRL